jgi:hypothetical protein
MIGEASSHGRRDQDLSLASLSASQASAQFMMRPAQVVGAADQPHACFQGREAAGSMARATGQAGQALAHRPIEAFDKSGIQCGSSC